MEKEVKSRQLSERLNTPRTGYNQVLSLCGLSIKYIFQNLVGEAGIEQAFEKRIHEDFLAFKTRECIR